MSISKSILSIVFLISAHSAGLFCNSALAARTSDILAFHDGLHGADAPGPVSPDVGHFGNGPSAPLGYAGPSSYSLPPMAPPPTPWQMPHQPPSSFLPSVAPAGANFSTVAPFSVPQLSWSGPASFSAPFPESTIAPPSSSFLGAGYFLLHGRILISKI